MRRKPFPVIAFVVQSKKVQIKILWGVKKVFRLAGDVLLDLRNHEGYSNYLLMLLIATIFHGVGGKVTFLYFLAMDYHPRFYF